MGNEILSLIYLFKTNALWMGETVLGSMRSLLANSVEINL